MTPDQILAQAEREAAEALLRQAEQEAAQAAGPSRAELVASAMADPGGERRFGTGLTEPERAAFWDDWETRRARQRAEAGPLPPLYPRQQQAQSADWFAQPMQPSDAEVAAARAGTEPRFPANEPYRGTWDERLLGRIVGADQPPITIDPVTGQRMPEPPASGIREPSWDEYLVGGLANVVTQAPERIARGVAGLTAYQGPGAMETLPPALEAVARPPAEMATPPVVDLPPAEGLGGKVAQLTPELAGFVLDMAITRGALPRAIPARTRELMSWELAELARGSPPAQGALMGLALGGIQALPGTGALAQAGKSTLESGVFGGLAAAGGAEGQDLALAAALPWVFTAYRAARAKGAPAVPSLEERAQRQLAEERATKPERPVPGAAGRPLPSETGLPGIDELPRPVAPDRLEPAPTPVEAPTRTVSPMSADLAARREQFNRRVLPLQKEIEEESAKTQRAKKKFQTTNSEKRVAELADEIERIRRQEFPDLVAQADRELRALHERLDRIPQAPVSSPESGEQGERPSLASSEPWRLSPAEIEQAQIDARVPEGKAARAAGVPQTVRPGVRWSQLNEQGERVGYEVAGVVKDRKGADVVRVRRLTDGEEFVVKGRGIRRIAAAIEQTGQARTGEKSEVRSETESGMIPVWRPGEGYTDTGLTARLNADAKQVGIDTQSSRFFQGKEPGRAYEVAGWGVEIGRDESNRPIITRVKPPEVQRAVEIPQTAQRHAGRRPRQVDAGHPAEGREGVSGRGPAGSQVPAAPQKEAVRGSPAQERMRAAVAEAEPLLRSIEQEREWRTPGEPFETQEQYQRKLRTIAEVAKKHRVSAVNLRRQVLYEAKPPKPEKGPVYGYGGVGERKYFGKTRESAEPVARTLAEAEAFRQKYRPSVQESLQTTTESDPSALQSAGSPPVRISEAEAHLAQGAERVRATARRKASRPGYVPDAELIARAEAVGINPAGRPAVVLQALVERAEAKQKPGRFLRPGTIGGPAPEGPRKRLAAEGGRAKWRLMAHALASDPAHPIRYLRQRGLLGQNETLPADVLSELRAEAAEIRSKQQARRERSRVQATGYYAGRILDIGRRRAEAKQAAETQARQAYERERREQMAGPWQSARTPYRSTSVPSYALDPNLTALRDFHRSLARRIVAVVAHEMKLQGWRVDHRSESGSIYVQKDDVRLRLSDHELGYADYGSRKQVHHGPEVVFTGRETPVQAQELVEEAIEEYGVQKLKSFRVVQQKTREQAAVADAEAIRRGQRQAAGSAIAPPQAGVSERPGKSAPSLPEESLKSTPPGRYLRPGTIGGPAPQGPRKRLAAEGARARAARPGESYEPRRGPSPEQLKQFEGSTPQTEKQAKAMTQAYAAAGAEEDGALIRLHDRLLGAGQPQTRQATAEVVRQALEWRRGKEMSQFRELETILQHDPRPLTQRIREQAARTMYRLRRGEYTQAIREAGRVLERVTPAERKELVYYLEKTGNPKVPGDTFEALSKRLSTPAKAAARRVSRWLEENRRAMAAFNWDPAYRLNYVTHMYKARQGRGTIAEREQAAFAKAYKAIQQLHALQGRTPPEPPKPGTPQYAKFQEFNPWMRKRWHDTYEQALIKEGLQPRYPDLLSLLRKRQEIELQNLTNVVIHKKLQDLRTADGLPVILPKSLAPKGWKEITHPAFRHLSRRVAIDPKTGDPIIENGKMRMDRVWETSMVHPDAYWSLAGLLQPPVGAHAATRWGASTIARAEQLNAIQKAMRLSLSFFHPFALAESAAAGGRLRIVKAMREGVKVARSPENAREMAAAGLQLGPSSDAEMGHFYNGMRWLEELAAKTPLAGKVLGGTVQAARIGKLGFDKALWDYMHTGLKAEAWYRHTARELARAERIAKREGRALYDDEIRTIKREAAKHVNAAFGGLNWQELFSVSGRGEKALRWVLLAPDWTYANLLIATDALRGLPAKAAALRRGDLRGAWEAGDVRGRLARRYWLHMAKTVVATTVVANYLFSGHFPWDNEIGHRFDIELPGRDERGHKRYLKPFKQAREVARILAVGTSLWNPVEYATRKSSPLLDAWIKQFLGSADYPEEWQILQEEGKEFHQQLWPRFKSLVKANVPYTLLGGGQFAAAIPVAKGMTYSKARQQLRNAYLNEEPGPDRDQLVQQILTAARENDPANAWWNAAHRNAVADIRRKWYAEIAAGLDRNASPERVREIVRKVKSLAGPNWSEADMWRSVAGRVSDETLRDLARVQRILGKVPEPFWKTRPQPKKSVEQEMRERTGRIVRPAG